MQQSWTCARDNARDSRTMDVAPSLSVRPQPALRPSALIPVGTYRATLTVIRGSNTGRLVAIGRNGLVVGRAPDADLVVDGDGMSRYHARLSADERGTFHVEDLGSANGTFLGTNQVNRSPLVSGDQLQFGRQLQLRFRIIDATEKSLNDAYGQLAGDRALSGVVRAIGSSIRVDNALARYGGEELAILAPLTNPLAATRLAERLRHAVAGLRLTTWGKNVHRTVSIGTASLSKVLRSSREPHLELLSLANERSSHAPPARREATFSGSIAPLRFGEAL